MFVRRFALRFSIHSFFSFLNIFILVSYLSSSVAKATLDAGSQDTRIADVIAKKAEQDKKKAEFANMHEEQLEQWFKAVQDSLALAQTELGIIFAELGEGDDSAIQVPINSSTGSRFQQLSRAGRSFIWTFENADWSKLFGLTKKEAAQKAAAALSEMSPFWLSKNISKTQVKLNSGSFYFLKHSDSMDIFPYSTFAEHQRNKTSYRIHATDILLRDERSIVSVSFEIKPGQFDMVVLISDPIENDGANFALARRNLRSSVTDALSGFSESSENWENLWLGSITQKNAQWIDEQSVTTVREFRFNFGSYIEEILSQSNQDVNYVEVVRSNGRLTPSQRFKMEFVRVLIRLAVMMHPDAPAVEPIQDFQKPALPLPTRHATKSTYMQKWMSRQSRLCSFLMSDEDDDSFD